MGTRGNARAPWWNWPRPGGCLAPGWSLAPPWWTPGPRMEPGAALVDARAPDGARRRAEGCPAQLKTTARRSEKRENGAESRIILDF